MCKSKAEGGQRCYSHAVARYAAAAGKSADADKRVQELAREVGYTGFGHMPVDHPKWSEYQQAHRDADQARKDFRTARVEYASTTKGQADIAAQATTAERVARKGTPSGLSNRDFQIARSLRDDAEKGLILRDANYLVGRGVTTRENLERTYPSVITDMAGRERALHEQERAVARRHASKNHNPAYPDYRGITPTKRYVNAGGDSHTTYTVNNVLHRDDGPAREWKDDGKKEWVQAGYYHRDDGPAVDYSDYAKRSWAKPQYWVHGTQVTELEHAKWVKAGRPRLMPTTQKTPITG